NLTSHIETEIFTGHTEIRSGWQGKCLNASCKFDAFRNSQIGVVDFHRKSTTEIHPGNSNGNISGEAPCKPRSIQNQKSASIGHLHKIIWRRSSESESHRTQAHPHDVLTTHISRLFHHKVSFD